MGKPYSEDLRNRIIEVINDGATIAEAAEQLGVSVSSVVRILRLYRETGSVSPAKFGGYRNLLSQHMKSGLGSGWRNSRISRWQSLRHGWPRKR